MPREPRIYLENVLYFITASGLEGRDLFNDAMDYEQYLKPLSEYKGEYGFRLFAFALLPKRLYLLIELKNQVTISTIMHNLNSKYTKTYNSRYGKKGHLFQSRFKSILVEKDDYLLRLTRYIHLLPRDGGLSQYPVEYPYSSFKAYVSGSVNAEAPDISEEIREVFSRLPQPESQDSLSKEYEAYVGSAEDREMELVRKLLHRKAFVGSEKFAREVQNRIKEHLVEEEAARVVRKTNPVFVVSGTFVILFLGVVAYNFYRSQSDLKRTLDLTASGFEMAREDLAQRVSILQSVVTGFEEKENYGLGGFAWEIQLSSVGDGAPYSTYVDQLQFKDGKIFSAKLMADGFLPFNYTMTQETHGKMIWRTSQTNAQGLSVRWYGIVAGDKMRGVLTKNPLGGPRRDFSFVSVGRISETGRLNYVVQ